MSIRQILIHDEQLRLIAKACKLLLEDLGETDAAALAKPCIDGCTVGEELSLLETMCNKTADEEPDESMTYGFAL
jgi:hypothetical protein